MAAAAVPFAFLRSVDRRRRDAEATSCFVRPIVRRRRGDARARTDRLVATLDLLVVVVVVIISRRRVVVLLSIVVVDREKLKQEFLHRPLDTEKLKEGNVNQLRRKRRR